MFNEVTFRALDWLLDEARCCQPSAVPPSSGRCILCTSYVFGNSGPITCSSDLVSQSSDAQFCNVLSIGMGLLAHNMSRIIGWRLGRCSTPYGRASQFRLLSVCHDNSAEQLSRRN